MRHGTRPFLIAAAMAVVLALLIGDITARMAATDANAQLAVDELTEVRVRAHAFWDNPMQRLLYRDMRSPANLPALTAVRATRSWPTPCAAYRSTAS